MIDEKRIADFFAELVSIDSPSLEEREMADTLKIKFAEIGVTFTEDHTQEQTGSNAGNLFARIPGSIARCAGSLCRPHGHGGARKREKGCFP